MNPKWQSLMITEIWKAIINDHSDLGLLIYYLEDKSKLKIAEKQIGEGKNKTCFRSIRQMLTAPFFSMINMDAKKKDMSL